MSDVGKLIKKFRKEQKMTLEELANKAGISAGYLSLLERGRRKSDVGKYLALAKGLKLSVSEAREILRATQAEELVIENLIQKEIQKEDSLPGVVRELGEETARFLLSSEVSKDELPQVWEIANAIKKHGLKFAEILENLEEFKVIIEKKREQEAGSKSE